MTLSATGKFFKENWNVSVVSERLQWPSQKVMWRTSTGKLCSSVLWSRDSNRGEQGLHMRGRPCEHLPVLGQEVGFPFLAQPCHLRLAQCKGRRMEARRSCCLLLERMKLKGGYSHPAMIPAAFLLSPSFQLCPSRFPHCFPVPRLLVRTWIPTRVPANPAAALKASQRFSCSMAPASFHLRFPSYQLIT